MGVATVTSYWEAMRENAALVEGRRQSHSRPWPYIYERKSRVVQIRFAIRCRKTLEILFFDFYTINPSLLFK